MQWLWDQGGYSSRKSKEEHKTVRIQQEQEEEEKTEVIQQE